MRILAIAIVLAAAASVQAQTFTAGGINYPLRRETINTWSYRSQSLNVHITIGDVIAFERDGTPVLSPPPHAVTAEIFGESGAVFTHWGAMPMNGRNPVNMGRSHPIPGGIRLPGTFYP